MAMWMNAFLCFQSADGSAENQMIVTSDDFSRQLYVSLFYKLSSSTPTSAALALAFQLQQSWWSGQTDQDFFHQLPQQSGQGLGRQIVNFERPLLCLPFHLCSF